MGPHSEKTREGYLTLEQARTEAARLSTLYRNPDTRDVREVLKKAVSVPLSASKPDTSVIQQTDSSISLLALAELYREQLKMRQKSSWRDVAGLIKRELASHLISHTPAHGVSSEQIIEILRPIIQRAKRQAGKLRSILNAAYEAALTSRLDAQSSSEWTRFGITSNPVRAIAKIDTHGTKDRHLNGREVGLLWLHLKHGKSATSISYRFLRVNILIGGQRCEQLLRCKLLDINEYDRTIILYDGKGSRSNPRKHILPLSDLAWQKISELLPIAKASGGNFLFPSRTSGKAANSTATAKTTVNISKELTSLKFDVRPMEPFSYGDLRRTTESLMADLDISKDIRAQVLSHGLSGIQHEHYDRSTYMRQKREALAIWQAYVLQMAEEQSGAYSQAVNNKAGGL